MVLESGAILISLYYTPLLQTYLFIRILALNPIGERFRTSSEVIQSFPHRIKCPPQCTDDVDYIIHDRASKQRIALLLSRALHQEVAYIFLP